MSEETDAIVPRGWDTPRVGLMMRHEWHDELLRRDELAPGSGDERAVDWIEVYPENYMRRGAKQLGELRGLRERFPFTSHGVHLSLGGTDPLSEPYLADVRAFFREFGVAWWSDHLGASIHRGELLNEILPVPLTPATAERVAARCQQAREAVGLPLSVENAAYYFVPRGSTLTEAEFTAQVLEQSGAGLVLDVNNLWVNAQNHGFSVDAFLDAIPLARVREIHIGGFHVDRAGGLFIDSHSAPPSHPVLRLLETTLARTGPKPVLLEWESHYRDLEQVVGAIAGLRRLWRRVAARASEAA